MATRRPAAQTHFPGSAALRGGCQGAPVTGRQDGGRGAHRPPLPRSLHPACKWGSARMEKRQGWKRRAFFDWRYVRSELRRSYRLAFILFWSILMYFLVQRYVVSAGVISETSMLPPLPEGDYYLVNKYIYLFAPAERGDIVVLRRDRFASEQYVKRVIGLPGESLQIRSGAVYINGRRLEEPYAHDPTSP